MNDMQMLANIAGMTAELIESGKLVRVVRCKDCIHRGKAEKCVIAAISKEKDYPLFMLDNRGEWFCADGVAKDINVPDKEGR